MGSESTRIREIAIEHEGVGRDLKEFIRIDIEAGHTGAGVSYRFEAHDIFIDINEPHPSTPIFHNQDRPPRLPIGVALRFESYDIESELRQWGVQEPMNKEQIDDLLQAADNSTSSTDPSRDDSLLFTPIKPVGVVGWYYDGEEIPDDVILAFAKRGYIIDHISTENNDYGGAYCQIVDRRGKEFTYKPGRWIVLSSAHRWASIVETTMLGQWGPV